MVRAFCIIAILDAVMQLIGVFILGLPYGFESHFASGLWSVLIYCFLTKE